LNGAYVVDPDGLEAPITSGAIKSTSTACFVATPNENANQGAKASKTNSEKNRKPSTSASTASSNEGSSNAEKNSGNPAQAKGASNPGQQSTRPQTFSQGRVTAAFSFGPFSISGSSESTSDITVAAYSDSFSLVTLENIPSFTAGKDEINMPVARIGSSVFGLRDQPFISFDGSTAQFLAPTGLLRDEQKTGDHVFWVQLFGPPVKGQDKEDTAADPGANWTTKVYTIPREPDDSATEGTSVCNISSTTLPVYLSSTGTGRTLKPIMLFLEADLAI
jgi:hypothetical protein